MQSWYAIMVCNRLAILSYMWFTSYHSSLTLLDDDTLHDVPIFSNPGNLILCMVSIQE
jgi:hypothetical protein